MIGFNYEGLKDRIYACWIGKNIGGTMGTPYEGTREVEVAALTGKKTALISVLSLAVTGVFYFILRYFDTANLIPSTISVTTSFAAASLVLCRSPYYGLAYASNDVVLIVLWVLASVKDPSYIPMVLCFMMFFAIV